MSALVASLHDAGQNVKAESTTALGLIGDATAVPALIELLGLSGEDDPFRLVRTEAVKSLATIGDVRALAFDHGHGDLRGFDVEAGAYLRFELGAGTEIAKIPGVRIEALASDPHTGRVVFADLTTHSLYVGDGGGVLTRIGAEGALGTADIVAMASGLMPMAYGLGGYEKMISPLSLAFAWGLLFATLITLFLVPALYAIINDFSQEKS